MYCVVQSLKTLAASGFNFYCPNFWQGTDKIFLFQKLKLFLNKSDMNNTIHIMLYERKFLIWD